MATSKPEPSHVERFRLASPAEPVFVATNSPDLAISPDGTRVVYKVRGPQGPLGLRSLEDLSIAPLTDGYVFAPTFSPDGRWVAFANTNNSTIEKVSVLGGQPVVVANVGPGGVLGISWVGEELIFGSTSAEGLQRVSAAGGEPESLTSPRTNTESHGWPDVLPGNRAALFTVLQPDTESAQIALLDFDTLQTTVLLPNGYHPRYVASGHLVYAAAGGLWAAPFDAERRTLGGEPTRVLGDVVSKSSGAVDFDVAGDGSLVYLRGDSRSVGRRRLVWVDRQGREEDVATPVRAYLTPRVAPDGSRIAVQQMDLDNEIWIWEPSSRNLSRLTFDPEWDRTPVWSPDGSSIFFTSGRDGAPKIFRRSAAGVGTSEKIYDEAVGSANDITPDGRFLVLASKRGLESLELEAERQLTLLVDDPTASQPRLSPDGRWLAYRSSISGVPEVYVRPFPAAADGRWQVSMSGGLDPVWAADGSELFYRTETDLMSVKVDTSDSFRAGSVEVLFATKIESHNSSYDVSADGRRFLMIRQSDDEGETAPELILVKNWVDELRRLVPDAG